MVHLLLAVIYLSFISLGLPDSLLGAAWPSMYGQLDVPVSYAGIISMVIAGGTVLSSLQSDRLTRRLGTGKVTAVSVGMTAAALFGFSASGSFWQLCLWAVPYGLGAGSVDAALNNYVAIHYASRHMSWLHCMWGVGTSLGPYIIGGALTSGAGWNVGYQRVALFQVALTAVLIASLPLWRSRRTEEDGLESGGRSRALSLGQIIRIPGVRAVMVTFFCYCAMEQTAILWASSYLVLCRGVSAETAAGFAGLFCIGITVGRALSGFLTVKLSDAQMVRLGQGAAAAGIAAMLLPLGETAALAGLVLTGLGCAPVYPCLIHSTPAHFGADRSQAIIGVQMASAYVGTCLMPPVFGMVAAHVTAALFPVYLLLLLVLMAAMHESLLRSGGKGESIY
ncbi:MAG: MFS transporter [Oscillibacter sp.]|jgi:fucose permease|nr:MFS transporter [Oscillibacter sp.]